MTICSTIVCSALAVSEYDRGDGTFDRFMTADVTIKAEGARYESFKLYCWIQVAVWVIGFPAVSVSVYDFVTRDRPG